MSEKQIERKREFVYHGVTEQEHIEINTVLGTLKQIAETEQNNIETLEEALESHIEARDWLVLAKKNFKSEKNRFYETKRLKQLEATERNIEEWRGEIKKLKERHDRTVAFIEDFEDNVAVTKTYDKENDKDVVHFSYNADFYKGVIAFAKIINLDGNFQ